MFRLLNWMTESSQVGDRTANERRRRHGSGALGPSGSSQCVGQAAAMVLRTAALAFVSASFLIAGLGYTTDAKAQAQTGTETLPALKAVTIERPPFTIHPGNGELTGFSIDLWREIEMLIGRRSEFEIATNFAEMLSAVETMRADAAIANITITSEREAVMDFSQPMFDSGLRVLVPDDGGSPTLLGALFNLEMQGLLALAGLLLFAASNAMWFFEHRKQPYFQYPWREGVWRSFWWALNVVVNGGFEERVPQSLPGRFFAVFLVVASLFIVSAFVAKITTTLTVGQLQTQIRSYTDLYGKSVGTTAGSTAAAFLRTHSIPAIEYERLDDMLTAVASRQVDAVVHDSPLLQYFAATRGRGRVRVGGDLLRPEKFGIALQQGSPLAEDINRAILKLREDGTFARLHAKWFDIR